MAFKSTIKLHVKKVVFIVILLAITFLLVINKEGFFYDKKGSFRVVNQNVPISISGNVLSFSFTADDNFLGTIDFRFADRLESNSGKVIFRIYPTDNENLLHLNEYRTVELTGLYRFPLGFPIFNDSKGKQYRVELEVVDNGFKQGFLKKGKMEVISKYDIPKEKIYSGEYSIALLILKKFHYLTTLKSFWVNLIFYVTFITGAPILLLEYFSKYYVQKKHKIDIYLGIFSVLNLVFNIYFLQDINTIYYFGYLFVLLIFTTYLNITENIYKVNLLFLLISTPLLLAFGKFDFAEYSGSWIWGILLTFLIYKTIKYFGFAIFIKRINIKRFSIKDAWVFTIGVIFLISIFSKNYTLGGDDTRMFYLYPGNFIKNFAVNIISDNAISGIYSYMPQLHWIPFSALLLFVKKIFFFGNIQTFLYLINYVLGVTFFYKMSELIFDENKRNRIILLISGIFYVFSAFNMFTTYDSQLANMYLISLFPLSVYLFIKSLKSRNVRYVLLLDLILSIISIVMISLPWVAALLLSAAPIFMYYLIKYKKLFLKHFLIFIFVFIVLNIYWIFPFFQSIVSKNNVISGIQSVVSLSYAKENISGISRLVKENHVFYPILNTFLYNIQKNNSWPYLNIFENWYLKILPLNLLLFIAILFAGFIIKRRNKLYTTYLIAVTSLLVSIYLFTVNITKYGIDLFNGLVTYIPGFVSFRNMYGKFGIAVSFSYAFIAAVSLIIIHNQFRDAKVRKFILLGFVLIVFLNAAPFIFGYFGRTPLWTTKNIHKTVRQINKDYMDLANYASAGNGIGRYLFLPLDYGNTVIIEDESWENHFYTGVSPFLILSGKNDFSGILSFSDFGKYILESINSGNFEETAKWFRRFNVEYIVVQNNLPQDIINSYYYQSNLYYAQNDKFKNTILGDHIKDFGSRYSLYKINSKFVNSKLYLTDDYDVFPNNFDTLSFTKLYSYKYDISINTSRLSDYLVFLESYQNGWKLYDYDGIQINRNTQAIPFGYANVWKLDQQALIKKYGPDQNLDLTLYFEPQKYLFGLYTISFSGGVLVILYLMYKYIKLRKWKN